LENVKDPRDKLAYSLGFYECMRVSEVVNLKPEEIDTNLKLIWIKQGKGSKDRKIPIAPEVWKGLKYLPINKGIRALQVSFKKIAKKVLNKDLHFHSLRHSGVTHYITVKRWDTQIVQRFAGHSRIDTTLIYTHIVPENLVKIMWEGQNPQV
jgi:integrase/recombinase XerD